MKIAMGLAALACAAAWGGDITTAQIDDARSMTYQSEIYLTTSNVNSTHFGKLFTLPVDGAIYAQPLYLSAQAVGRRTVNMVYTATSHNNVYAFDADNPSGSPVWTANLGPYVTIPGWTTGLGVMSTPVIVRSTNALYLIATTSQNGNRVFQLHALDLLTGAEKFGGPVTIAGSVPGTASGSVAFNANQATQRAGLAQSGNNVMITFSSDRDGGLYYGWVFAYDIRTLARTGIFNDALNNTTGGTGAGIWQSGRAPAVDTNGDVYLETGNGGYDGTADFGETLARLTPGVQSLTLADWFTPAAWDALNQVDYDLGSTGPTLIPGTNLVFGGAKSGTIYLLSKSSLGHVTTNDVAAVQEFTATSGCQIPFVDQGCAQIMGQVFWASAATPTLYIWGVHDVLRAYQFNGQLFNTIPSSVGATQANYPGGVMALSSYKGTPGTGILWAILCDTPDNGFYFGPGFNGAASLHAYDAANPSTELWNSNQNSIRDGLGELASWAPPVAINGKVYVPTFSNELAVYGLLNGPVPGDVNGDSKVDCSDLAIVQAAFGTIRGQPRYDLRADVNGDGVVGVQDLAAVVQHLPAGTTCR